MEIDRSRFLKDGYLIVRELIPPPMLDSLRADFEAIVTQRTLAEERVEAAEMAIDLRLQEEADAEREQREKREAKASLSAQGSRPSTRILLRILEGCNVGWMARENIFKFGHVPGSYQYLLNVAKGIT